MINVIEAPLDLVEAVAQLRFPPKTDQFLQQLMDGNTNGSLTPDQREEMKALVELNEMMSLVRARALHLLGQQPS